MKYGSLQSITVENLYHTLNLWIQGTGATTYPELSFRSWEKEKVCLLFWFLLNTIFPKIKTWSPQNVVFLCQMQKLKP